VVENSRKKTATPRKIRAATASMPRLSLKAAPKYGRRAKVSIPAAVPNSPPSKPSSYPTQSGAKFKDQLNNSFWVNQDAATPPDDKWPGPWGIAPTEGISHPDPNWLKLRSFVPTPNGAIDIGNDSENIYWQATSVSDYAGSWNFYVFVKDANEYSLKLYHNGHKSRRKIWRYGTDAENQ